MFIIINVMNLSKIFEMQKALDQAIMSQHNVKHDQIISQRIIALIVEVAEFANEVASFKYWKKQKNFERDKTLEEFIDGIHFYVSLSLQLNVDDKIHSKIICNDFDTQLLAVFASITDLQKDFRQEKLISSFSLYLGLARLCNISNQEIEDTYILKNKINYERLANNY